MRTDYWTAIKEETEILAKDPSTIFLGQQCLSENFYGFLENVPVEKRREMPVMEDCQLGLSIGLALEGYLPVSIIQRMDFLPRMMDQLINHLNLLPGLSRGRFNPKVIIITTIGTVSPLDVGLQHRKDLTEMLKACLGFPVIKVITPQGVHNAYKLARKGTGPIMILEEQKLFNT